jgi:DNA mismatch repair protein MutS2
VRDARAELRGLRERLRGTEQGAPDALRAAERTIDAAARNVSIGSPLAVALAATSDAAASVVGDAAVRAGGGAPEPSFEVGSQVWLPKLGMLARVVELGRGGRLQVQAGSMRLTVKRGEAEPAARAPAASRQSAARTERARARPTEAAASSFGSSGEPGAGFQPMRTESNTVDLRGMRVDEAIERVEQFVDEMLRAAEPAGFVLHGHGTGALKAAVREHLALSRWVTQSRAADEGDGGDAFTVFRLRG